MSNRIPAVVIVGGGFGGLAAAEDLKRMSFWLTAQTTSLRLA